MTALLWRLLFRAMVAWALASPASAQLVANGTFDQTVDDWIASSAGTLVWDALDADASPFSGSALGTNHHPNTGGEVWFWQCIPGVVAGETYLFGADLLIPSSNTQTGEGFLRLRFAESETCSNVLNSVFTDDVTSATADSWVRVEAEATAPPTARAMELRLFNRKNEAGGSFAIHYDNVAVDELIFSDGFESGDTSAWSVVTLP